MASSTDRIADIFWSPNRNNHFIIYENEISLYRLKYSKESNKEEDSSK